MFTFKGIIISIHMEDQVLEVKHDSGEIQFLEVTIKDIIALKENQRVKITLDENEKVVSIAPDKFDPNWDEKGELPGEIHGDRRY